LPWRSFSSYEREKRWKGYLMDYGEPSKPVFTLQDPKVLLSCMTGDVRVTVEPKGRKQQ
jgi:hypothetical protein